MSSFVKIKQYLLNNRVQSTFWLFFCISFLIRIYLMMQPAHPAWDASVYQGMAVAIGSGGTYGVWEMFRPPFLPLVLSPFSSLDPFVLEWIAKIITLVASLGIIYLVYRIGEKIDHWVGVIASILISFSMPFLAFSVIPMTEIPSLFFITLAIYCFGNKKYFLAGVVAGLAFLTRFPTGLILGAIGISLIFQTLHVSTLREDINLLIRRGFVILCGFFLVAGPFFILSNVFYGSALLPITEGQGMISKFLWLYPGNYFYYPLKILTNIVTVFAIPGIIIALVRWRKLGSESRNILRVLFVTILVFLLYFTSQAHKEFRYALPMFSTVFLIAAAGMVWMQKKWSWLRYPILIFAIIGIIISLVVGKIFIHRDRYDIEQFYNFYTALQDAPLGSSVITSTPTIAAFSPVRLYEGYNSWAQMNEMYEQEKTHADYVAIDTCELYVCEPGNETQCIKDQEIFLSKLYRESKVVYQGKSRQCEFIISSINH